MARYPIRRSTVPSWKFIRVSERKRSSDARHRGNGREFLMRRALIMALAGAALTTATPAMAAAIVNGDGSVTFNGAAGSNTVNLTYNGLAGDPKALTPGLSGVMALTLSSISGN